MSLLSRTQKSKIIQISETNSSEFKRKTKFAPLVSVEVERSFSKYKSLLSEKRINLTENNIEKFIVIQFNDFL
jgi:hypothetical protein